MSEALLRVGLPFPVFVVFTIVMRLYTCLGGGRSCRTPNTVPLVGGGRHPDRIRNLHVLSVGVGGDVVPEIVTSG